MNTDPRRISTNFSKGLNLSVPHLISPEECQQADNILFSNGAYVREGTAVNASLPFPVVALKKHYKQDGTSYFTAFAGGKVYVSSTSGVFTNISCETLASGDVSVTSYDDYLYFTNLSNAVKLFDGSVIDNAGLSSPVFIKYIGDFDDPAAWSKTNPGDLVRDYTYLHTDRGANSLLLAAGIDAESIVVNVSSCDNLTEFAPGVPSTTNDLIQIFTVPLPKASVSSLLLIFKAAGNSQASVDLARLSSWVYSANDSWSMTHSVPKVCFAITSGFAWTSCRTSINFYSTNTSSAVAIDNLRMVKSPPVVSSIAISGEGLWFGYVNSRIDRYAPSADIAPDSYASKWAWLIEGTQWGTISSPNQPGIGFDGREYYKVTFVKRGPGGVEIESNPSYQTSGVLLSSFTYTSNIVMDGPTELSSPSYSGTIYGTSGTIFSTFLATRFIANLTNIPVAPFSLGVTGRKIYRRNITEPVMRHAYTIADNTTTVFRDDIPQEVLGGVLDETRWPPPKAKWIYTAASQQTYYLNLIEEDGVRYASRIRFSQPYAPHYVPLENVLDVSPNDGYEITGVFEFMNLLHILKGGSTWMIDNGSLIKIHPSYGSIAPKSLAVGPQEVFWLSDEGIIKYNLRFKNISLEDSKIAPLLDGLDRVSLQDAAGIYFRGFYLLAMNNGTGTGNNTVLCYDNTNDLWSVFPNINVNCWSVWSGARDGYRLFYGNNSGLVCEFLTGNTDFGQAIPWAVRTKEFGNPSPTTTLRNIWLYTQSLNNSGQVITLTPYYDFVASSGDIVSITSGYLQSKATLPPTDDAGYLSVGLSGAGRIRLIHMDNYEKEEGLR